MIHPLTPERYRLQCTIDAETQEQFRRPQHLLRREIPDGEAGQDEAAEVLARGYPSRDG